MDAEVVFEPGVPGLPPGASWERDTPTKIPSRLGLHGHPTNGRRRLRFLLLAFPSLLLAGLATAAAVAAEPGERPVMRELPPAAFERPPSQRELVDARGELQRRFREPLFRAGTAAGANRAAEVLLDAAVGEPDRALKWEMLAEARRLAVAAGNALVIDQAIVLASASYEFDEIETELRALTEIPLRGLDPGRAMRLAEVAERLATRAETDRRFDDAIAAQSLAIRAWQRAGNKAAALKAAERHDAIAGKRAPL